MLRIYLDTNLLLRLNDDKYSSLKEILSLYADYINIVYSSAHISDLEKSSNIELTMKDLDTIKSYTENQCLAKYWGEENLRYDIRDPFEFNETSKDTSVDVVGALKFLEKECQKLGIENPINNLKKLNLDISDDVPDKIDYQTSFFKTFQKEQSFNALFDDVAELLQVSLTSNDLLKEVRTHFDKQIPRKVIGNIKEDVIDYFNREIPKTVYNKTFEELVDESLKIGNKNTNSFFNRFVTRYNILDLVGYKSDNKSSTPNIIADSFHAYYAAHCDIFISEDGRLRDKAKIIYKEFNIDIPIFSEKEFCESIDDLILIIQNSEAFVKLINDVKVSEFISYYSDLNSKTSVTEYYLKFFFAGYFNYVIWARTIDEVSILSFIKVENGCSNWFYYRELRSLVKVFFDWLGPDLNNNCEIIHYDQEINEDGIWIGRRWFFENVFITLFKDEEVGLTFRLELLNN